MKIRVLLSLLPIIALVAGCATKKPQTADQYFNLATDSFQTGALTLAVDQYRELLDQHPFSEYNEEAELKIAHAHYLLGNYTEAIVALSDFQRRHPTSPHLPFIGYYLGMCYAQQMGTVDRDQSAAQNAQTYFMTVMNQYPDSPYAELARQQLARCRRSLADHELYVAAFYLRRGNQRAGEVRLLDLAARYSDTDPAAEGLLRLARQYRRDERDEQAILAYQALTRAHPRSPQAATARRALSRLTKAEEPAGTSDPLDVLLAAHGRQRSTSSFQVVQVPGLEPSRSARRSAAAVPGPALGPAFDPFGQSRPY